MFCQEFKVPPIEVIGSHGQVTVCALPPWLPEHVVEKMVLKFASDLGKILSRLGDISRKCSNSVTSVDSTPLSEDKGSNENDLDILDEGLNDDEWE